MTFSKLPKGVVCSRCNRSCKTHLFTCRAGHGKHLRHQDSRKKKLGIDDTFNSEAHRLKIECISLSGSIFISCKIELIFGRLTVIVVYLHFILEKFDFKQKTQFSKQSEFYKSGC